MAAITGPQNTKEEPPQKPESNPYKMTEDILKKRAAVVDKGRRVTQLYLALTIALGAINSGLTMSWSQYSIRHQMDKEEAEDLEQYALIASIPPLGFCLGNLCMNYFAIAYGPRRIMLVASPILCGIWIAVTCSEGFIIDSVTIFLASFFSTPLISSGETLLEECIHPQNMKKYYILYGSSMYFGVGMSYMSGAFITNIDYSIIPAISNGIMFISLIFLPESPVYLYNNRYPAKAEQTLKFYKGDRHIHADLNEIKRDAESRRADVSMKFMLYKPVVYKAIIIIISLTFFQVFSGFYAFLAYGFYIWNKNALDQNSKNELLKDSIGRIEDSIILTIVYYVSSLASISIHYGAPFGVRKPLIISMFFVMISLFTISGFLYTFQYNPDFDSYTWIEVILLSILIISYLSGLNMYPEIIQYYYLPQQVYPWVRSLNFSFRWLIALLVVRFTFVIHIHLSPAGGILLLACVSFIGFIFCCVCVIETKGKTLLQLQMKLGGNPIGSRSHYRRREVVAL